MNLDQWLTTIGAIAAAVTSVVNVFRTNRTNDQVSQANQKLDKAMEVRREIHADIKSELTK